MILVAYIYIYDERESTRLEEQRGYDLEYMMILEF
jgi:hypothetical protein